MFSCPECSKSVGILNAIKLVLVTNVINCPSCGQSIVLKNLYMPAAIFLIVYAGIYNYILEEKIDINLFVVFLVWITLLILLVLIIFPARVDKRGRRD